MEEGGGYRVPHPNLSFVPSKSPYRERIAAADWGRMQTAGRSFVTLQLRFLAAGWGGMARERNHFRLPTERASLGCSAVTVVGIAADLLTAYMLQGSKSHKMGIYPSLRKAFKVSTGNQAHESSGRRC